MSRGFQSVKKQKEFEVSVTDEAICICKVEFRFLTGHECAGVSPEPVAQQESSRTSQLRVGGLILFFLLDFAFCFS